MLERLSICMLRVSDCPRPLCAHKQLSISLAACMMEVRTSVGTLTRTDPSALSIVTLDQKNVGARIALSLIQKVEDSLCEHGVSALL